MYKYIFSNEINVGFLRLNLNRDRKLNLYKLKIACQTYEKKFAESHVIFEQKEFSNLSD